MKPVAFDQLAGIPLLQHYREAFRNATGVSLRLVSLDQQKQRVNFWQGENPFCALVGSTSAGGDACLETQVRIQRRTVRKLVTQQIFCFAGLAEFGVSMVIIGLHVATWMNGQVFRREPTARGRPRQKIHPVLTPRNPSRLSRCCNTSM